ncbi:hypothetical protein MKZ38_009097 [Zalerion maritima]|uniref:Uncharacterized protein n=1 Tax=Zalerion maritima TaxID=339359 RepID=A0AAD5WT47_9PEZI|nr:hypothetical protein MKZ38_009097 [Zalerion maritima]
MPILFSSFHGFLDKSLIVSFLLLWVPSVARTKKAYDKPIVPEQRHSVNLTQPGYLLSLRRALGAFISSKEDNNTTYPGDDTRATNSRIQGHQNFSLVSQTPADESRPFLLTNSCTGLDPDDTSVLRNKFFFESSMFTTPFASEPKTIADSKTLHSFAIPIEVVEKKKAKRTIFGASGQPKSLTFRGRGFIFPQNNMGPPPKRPTFGQPGLKNPFAAYPRKTPKSLAREVQHTGTTHVFGKPSVFAPASPPRTKCVDAPLPAGGCGSDQIGFGSIPRKVDESTCRSSPPKGTDPEQVRIEGLARKHINRTSRSVQRAYEMGKAAHKEAEIQYRKQDGEPRSDADIDAECAARGGIVLNIQILLRYTHTMDKVLEQPEDYISPPAKTGERIAHIKKAIKQIHQEIERLAHVVGENRILEHDDKTFFGAAAKALHFTKCLEEDYIEFIKSLGKDMDEVYQSHKKAWDSISDRLWESGMWLVKCDDNPVFREENAKPPKMRVLLEEIQRYATVLQVSNLDFTKKQGPETPFHGFIKDGWKGLKVDEHSGPDSHKPEYHRKGRKRKQIRKCDDAVIKSIQESRSKESRQNGWEHKSVPRDLKGQVITERNTGPSQRRVTFFSDVKARAVYYD